YGGGGGGSDNFSGVNFIGGGGGGGGSSLVPAGWGCAQNGFGDGSVSITYTGGIIATASNTGPYCEEETIQLNGPGGVPTYIYSWTGPNGFTSNAQSPSIPNATPAMSGVYQLILTDSSCPESDTATTTVVVNPKPDVDAVTDQIVCHGDNTQAVSFNGTVANTVFDWTNDNTTTGLPGTGSGDIAAFQGNAVGTVEVSNVEVTPSTAFCVGDPESFSITVLPSPTISVSNDTTICENGTATLIATGAGGGGGPYTYFWDFTTNGDAIQYVDPLNPTSYSVYVENPYGCESGTEVIDVTLNPPLTGTISPFDTVCPGYDTDLFATVSGGIGQPYTFVWSEGSTFTGVGNHSINVAPAATTDYSVTITDGCESTPLVMGTNVRVAPLPVPEVDVLNPVQCEPAIFDIVNTTDPALSQYNYWLVDGTQQFLNQDTITTTEMWAGEYDVQLVVTSYEGCVDSVTWSELLSVDPKPVADFKYSPNPVLMFNTQVLFTNYSFNGYTYQWFFEDGVPSQSTQTNVQVLFPDGVEGRYDVQLITTSELGCVDTMNQELIVYPEVLIYAPNAFTPDGDEHNQTWRVFMEGIDVYDFELLIFNRWGEVIWESHDLEVGWDGTYGGKPVETGMYTWIIRTKDLQNDAKYTFDGHINLLK
ncbi:MAG: gliding motility-associated C-terminal domain-containing protein, partial [Flavobacteriales bacterium]|nr:gliding motility-associated C-terminal domain-containing protein [Flavobacteriales bacterium]